MKGILLDPTGIYRKVEVRESSSASEDKATLKDLYRLIGCDTVDVVRLTPTLDMWLDDEGMYTQEENIAAAFIVYAYWRAIHQGYYGTVVFLGGADVDGDTLGLSDATELDLLSKLVRFGVVPKEENAL